MRVGTVTLIKAPLERTLEWVAYHLNVGIDEMHLYFDDPQDPAIEVLSAYPAVHCHPCDEAFWLKKRRPTGVPSFVQEKQRIILRRVLRNPPPGLDWFVHIDSDELLWAPGDVRKTFAKETKGITHLQIPAMEAVPPSPDMGDPFREVRLFKEKRKERFDWAKRLHADATFHGNRYFRGYVKGKPAVKLDGSVVAMRTHGPTKITVKKYKKAVAHELRILHFDAGSFADWKAKWEMRDQHSLSGVSKSRKRQTRRFERLSRDGDDATMLSLYRNEYMLTARDARVLRMLGLVRKIKLSDTLFVMPSR